MADMNLEDRKAIIAPEQKIAYFELLERREVASSAVRHPPAQGGFIGAGSQAARIGRRSRLQ